MTRHRNFFLSFTGVASLLLRSVEQSVEQNSYEIRGSVWWCGARKGDGPVMIFAMVTGGSGFSASKKFSSSQFTPSKERDG
jgi:hypothetical protein